MTIPSSPPTIQSKKQELEKERDRIKAILARRGHKDPNASGKYVPDFPEVGSEIDDEVFEDEQYEVNVAVEQVLEKRLQKIEEDLKKIRQGTYEL